MESSTPSNGRKAQTPASLAGSESSENTVSTDGLLVLG